jgi:hypothetical protein
LSLALWQAILFRLFILLLWVGVGVGAKTLSPDLLTSCQSAEIFEKSQKRFSKGLERFQS